MMQDDVVCREKVESPRTRWNGWVLIVMAATVVATAVKVWLAMHTFGSNDVLYWERFLHGYQDLGGVGLYRQHGLFNHPPFMIHVLRAMGCLASATEIWFPFWLRLPAILADVGSVVLVHRILRTQFKGRSAKLALVLMAAAPISILTSGFHGNTDPVMIFFVLLSIYLLERKHPLWLAGAALGLSMSIKVVPVIFMPAVFLWLPDLRKRVEYFTAVAITFGILSLPYLVLDPVIVAAKVFGYGSIYGHWGISRLTSWLPTDLAWIDAGFERVGRYAAMGAVIAASFWMNRRKNRLSLFMQCGLILFLFMTLSPGFGIQYLAWLVPWVVGLGVWACALCYATGGVFQFLVYNYWSRGLWYFADSDTVRDWKGSIIGFEVLCWVAVVIIAAAFIHIASPRSRQAIPHACTSGEDLPVR